MNDKQYRVKRSVINGMPITAPNPSTPRQTTTRPITRSSQPIMKSARPASRPTRPTTRLIQPTTRPARSTTKPTSSTRPTVLTKPTAPVKPASTEPTIQAKSTQSKPTNKGLIIGICIGLVVLVCAGIGVGIYFATQNNSQEPEITTENNTDTSTDSTEENIDETKRITEETVNKYADITVEGYQNVDNESFSGPAVVVSLRNNSEEVVSIAVTMGAYDTEDNLLDTSSVYAENIQPGETHTFNTFVFTNLTPEQLETAVYKVYKASTYTATGVEEQIVTDEQPTTEEQTETNITETTEGTATPTTE